MFGEKDFEIAYQYLCKNRYQKALPHLYQAAQKGHTLAYVWIENIYAYGLDAEEITPMHEEIGFMAERAVLHAGRVT